MPISTPILLVITVLAAARVTRLINEDKILDAPRNAIWRRLPENSMIAYWIGCPWCAGLWVCAGAVALLYLYGHSIWYQAPALALAASHIVGLLKKLEDGR
jgi:fatty acid desaturase